MKLEKEEFDKLSQLDRIEFRQKEQEISERYNNDNFYNFFLILSILIAGFSMLLVAHATIYEELGIEESRLNSVKIGSSLLSSSAILCLAISIFFMILDYARKERKLNNLEREYFKPVKK